MVREAIAGTNALWLTEGELGARLYFTKAYPRSVRGGLIQTLIEASARQKGSWDAVNLIEQGLLKHRVFRHPIN